MSGASLELEVTSDPQRLPQLREDVRRWVLAQGWTERQAGELVLALDEAVTNVIRHGYGGRPQQRILVTAEVIRDAQEGEGVELCIRDYGRQVDPKQICGRDLEDVRPGGLGVHIIHAMTSTCEYQRAEGGGMRLIMRKYRSHVAKSGDRSEAS